MTQTTNSLFPVFLPLLALTLPSLLYCSINRWEQAFNVAHCALSLVGEPIMYPHINELVGELHRRRISTFLVTNAQVCIALYVCMYGCALDVPIMCIPITMN